jgi:hypothetical protein
LVYAGDVNTLGESVRNIKENVEALLVAKKGTGLEVNDDKTKYMVMPRDKNAAKHQSTKIDNKSSKQCIIRRKATTNKIPFRNKLRAD